MQLLDGSLAGAGGQTNSFGALYGVRAADEDLATTYTLTSDIVGTKITFVDGASKPGGENAVWQKAGNELKINLVAGRTYTDAEIQDLIDNATEPKSAGLTGSPQKLTWSTSTGVMTAAAKSTSLTAVGTRETATIDLSKNVADGTNGGIGSSDSMKITANTYGDAKFNKQSFAKITINFDVAPDKENVETTADMVEGTSGAEVTLHLSTGVEYTEEDIENILKEGGYDYSVELTDAKSPDGSTDGKFLANVKTAIDETEITAGTGVGKEFVANSGEGLTFQIGANGVEDQRVTLNVDDMSSAAIGVANADVSTREAANEAIKMVDKAVKTVSMQRAGLGAMQNRLEYTVNNLTTTSENLTNAESQIRDTDMATEMINYTKFNILQQASQAMLAQANQQPQAVLQLLG